FDLSSSKLTISAQDVDYAMSGHESMACQYDGEEIAIGFKSPFVQEILSNIESENVVLELSDPTRPGLFLPFEHEDEDEDLLMLLMPMMV
ncbi:DNA polymerase III subunit beta, partial [Odoribacter sp. OttesenSCG-928-A06]|nr:DNA polymerase III subunit beta [Odoribacter sp. OttesenSCG-928-A06]